MKLYTTLAGLFWLYRQYAIPNPFEVLGEQIIFTIGEITVPLTPDVLNWLADPIIFAITFGIVGIYYERGSFPVLGSILYMFFYCLHMAGIYFLLSLYPMVWLIIIILVLYVVLHICGFVIKNRFFYY